jgi:hypothetical protein
MLVELILVVAHVAEAVVLEHLWFLAGGWRAAAGGCCAHRDRTRKHLRLLALSSESQRTL